MTTGELTTPQTKYVQSFPNCDRGDQCLYKHEGSNNDVLSGDANQAQRNETKITCRTCTQEFSDKNEMMVHRKIDHLSEVKMCKNILAGVNCRKGPVYCWYRHNQNDEPTRSTPLNNIRAPAFNVQNFPYGPTPQRAVVGQNHVSLQMIQQTLQAQQHQMSVIMAELMRLRQ